jgi:class 3 adenylate cyclase
MFMEEFHGAVLFADISGFTALAETLEKNKRYFVSLV